MKRILFIDRDGTMIKEAPPLPDRQLGKEAGILSEVFHYLGFIAAKLDYDW